MTGLYERFGTDSQKETEGVTLDFGDFKIKIRRLGGRSKELAKWQTKLNQKYNLTMKDMTVDNADEMMRYITELAAQYLIADWQTKTPGGQWRKGIDQRGKIVPFTTANVLKVLNDLPDFTDLIIKEATDVEKFREGALDVIAKKL